MTFSEKLKNTLANYHLLLHPFYQAWTQGTIPRETLKKYATQYYTHVKAFPRYISAAHSKCEDIEKRRILLENLADEEGFNGGEAHPELWLRFAEGLGVSRTEVENAPASQSIKNVVNTFLSAANSSYTEGLASLYAYEYQVPEIAKTKIEGLKEHYNLKDSRSLSFFTVHQEADVHHRRECEKLIDDFPEKEQSAVLSAAKQSAKALWDFLSDMHSSSCSENRSYT